MQPPMWRVPAQEEPIETPRLLLLTVTEAALAADQVGQGLGELLGVIVPATWPPQYWDQKAIEYLYRRIQSHAGLPRDGAAMSP